MDPAFVEIIKYPFAIVAGSAVVLTMLFRGFAAGKYPLLGAYAIAAVIASGGAPSFASGVIAGVVANEITHWLRNKKGEKSE